MFRQSRGRPTPTAVTVTVTPLRGNQHRAGFNYPMPGPAVQADACEDGGQPESRAKWPTETAQPAAVRVAPVIAHPGPPGPLPYCLGSGAVSAIHRKVQNDWHNVLPIVNALASRLQSKRARSNR